MEFLKIPKMMVYNRYTYESLGFKDIISSIYEELVYSQSSSMLKSIIFVPFDTHIFTTFFCIYSLYKISYYPAVIILDLI